jgi:hypothetical protein
VIKLQITIINFVYLAIEQRVARITARDAELTANKDGTPVTTPSTPSEEAVGHAPQISGSTTQEPVLSKLNDKKPPESKSPERKPPERKLPERKLPERKLPERKLPERKLPERKLPERKLPERKLPERELPERKPFEWKSFKRKPPEWKTSPLHSSEPILLGNAPRKKSWLSVFRNDPSQDLFKAIIAQHDEEFLKALKNGANPYETVKDDVNEFAAIHMVAKYGTVAMLSALLQIGVLPRMRTAFPPNGKMALHLAVIRNSRPMVERLLQAHAPLDAVDNKARTPLSYAAFYDLVDIARLLLESGANVEATSSLKFTPLYVAVCGSEGVGNKMRLQMVTLLIEFGAEVNAVDTGGKTPLFYAVRLERFGEAKLLLAAGANINAFDNLHRTPLVRSIYENQLSAFRFLTENGADMPSMESLNAQQRENLNLLLKAPRSRNGKSSRFMVS